MEKGEKKKKEEEEAAAAAGDEKLLEKLSHNEILQTFNTLKNYSMREKKASN